MSRPFEAGERVLLLDSKGRRYLVTLGVGGEFHTQSGPVAHDGLLGREEGTVARTSRGARFVAVRPTLAEVILKMPRGAQVIYPKDIGPLLVMADVFPGARIFESGLGSGALSMALLRAGAHITGYELREDFANRARANVAAYLGEGALEHYDVHIRDSYEGIDAVGLDRVVLDLPEPWQVVPHARTALRPGGLMVAYLPTILQVATLRAALDAHGYGMAETVEVLQRSWHIEGQSVRPNHRMVAHTGFLTVARLLDPDRRAEVPHPGDAALAGPADAAPAGPGDAALAGPGVGPAGEG